MPILSERTKEQLAAICPEEIEMIPVEVESTSKPFYILRPLNEIECVDVSNSDFTKWQEGDGRPDKIGEYRTGHTPYS